MQCFELNGDPGEFLPKGVILCWYFVSCSLHSLTQVEASCQRACLVTADQYLCPERALVNSEVKILLSRKAAFERSSHRTEWLRQRLGALSYINHAEPVTIPSGS